MGNKNPLEGMELVNRSAQCIFRKKVEDVSLVDLKGLSNLTDYYLICTCQSEAQMRAALNDTFKVLSKEGCKALRSEYAPGVRWAILDYGDLIIHFFEKKTREYYALERLWGDARINRLNPDDYRVPEEENNEDDDEL